MGHDDDFENHPINDLPDDEWPCWVKTAATVVLLVGAAWLLGVLRL